MTRRCWLLGLLVTLSVSNPAWTYTGGAAIYQTGTGRSGRQIVGRLPGQLSLQGDAVACAGCHGAEGKGGGESFIKAPALAARNDVSRAAFARAVTQGMGQDGRLRDPMMPRFDLADDEIDALLTYLQTLGRQPSQTRRVALALLPEPGINPLADKLADQLQQCAMLPAGSRLWPLDTLRYRDPLQAIEQLSQRLQAGDVRFILAPFVIGWESRYASLMLQYDVPTLMPISHDGLTGAPVYLAFPDVSQALQALIDDAVRRGVKTLRLLPSDLAPDSNRALKAYAKRRGVRLLADDKASKSPGVKTWLIVSPMATLRSAIRSAIGPNDHALIPAAYFTPDDATFVSNWRLAYPYPPRLPNGEWQSPVARWADVACHSLAYSVEHPEQAWWQQPMPESWRERVPSNAVVLPWPTP